MNEELLYALAPDGSTHTICDKYRKYDKETNAWFFLSLEFKEWAPVPFPSPNRYIPIPERQLAINLVAGKYSEWPKPDKFYTFYTQYQITWAEWSARRALRIEHGLIATLTDKGAKVDIEIKVPIENGKNRYGLDMSFFRNLINRELNQPLDN